MHNRVKKIFMPFLFLGLISVLFPVTTMAGLEMQIDTVSGKITHKYPNHSLQLDNGKTYYASREGLVVNLSLGEAVTLRYMIEDSKSIFFEFAPGFNSLQKLNPEPTQEDNSPN
ncbi:MAG: hypothetical protein JZU65_06280 [Chlorobium sp.]|nr:hypothetical protein [Chlorobium sp.]